MNDGQIITLAAINPAGPRKLAEVQDHAGGKAVIGRAAMGMRPRVMKEVTNPDGTRTMLPFDSEEPSNPPETVVTAPAPVAAVTLPQPTPRMTAAPPVSVGSKAMLAGKELAEWALNQPAEGGDTPWSAIKEFLGEPPYPAAKQKRIRVQMTGGGLGKVTLFLSTFAASERLVILGFPLDGSTAIVEPPPAGAEDPLRITVDGKVYECISGDWSAEVGQQLLVALPRLTKETA